MNVSTNAISNTPLTRGGSHEPFLRGRLGNNPAAPTNDAGAFTLKSPEQILQIRAAGSVVHRALQAAARSCRPGVTTAEVDRAASEVLLAAGGESLFLDYPSAGGGAAFPANTCISVNNEVVHGIPGRRVLAEGDLVTIDCGVRLNGWCADSALTVPVGRADGRSLRLVDDANRLLAAAIAMVRPGRRWSEVARVIEAASRRQGYGVVREYVGHGIGRRLHEPPQVPCFLSPGFVRGYDFVLTPGLVLCIEPMLTLGSAETEVDADGWTVRTRDGSCACHVEHTIAVTRFGAEVLTDGRAF